MNKLSIEQLSILVEFLGNVLGPDYEIVLHDLTNDNNCIVAIVNGYISNRKVGSPITDASLNLLSNKAYEQQDFIANYKGLAKDGRILRSSTWFIKDENGIPYALLCINFDDSRFIDLHDKILSVAHPISFLKKYSDHTLQYMDQYEAAEAPSITERMAPDIDVLRNTIYSSVIATVNIPEERLNQEERIEVIRLLNEQGFFKLKGAVSYLSHKFECSAASIYRYLNEVKQ